MFSRILTAVRRNVVAWLALFVALTGTSMAASHYIITSTHQIKPSVLKRLRGARGTTGATGAAGAQGKEGPPGKEGPAGKEGFVGKSGLKGETGPQGKEGPAGPAGKEGPAGGKEGPAGPKGEAGAEGKAGSALAFAHVTATEAEETKKEAKAEAANSKGFEGATITNPAKGIYCISGLTVEQHNVEATVDNKAVESVSTAGFFATATVGRSFFAVKEALCASTQVTVETWELKESAGKLTESRTANAPFYITVN